MHCGVPQWLQPQLGTLVVPPGPVTRDQGRQCWWLEFMLCTHSAVELAAAAYVVPRTGFTFIHSGGTRAGRKCWGQLLVHWQLQGPWLLVCPPLAAQTHFGHAHGSEADDRDQARGLQMHMQGSWHAVLWLHGPSQVSLLQLRPVMSIRAAARKA